MPFSRVSAYKIFSGLGQESLWSTRDITDKTAENFSGHLVVPNHEFGGIFVRSVHLKLPEKFSGQLVVSFSRENSLNT